MTKLLPALYQPVQDRAANKDGKSGVRMYTPGAAEIILVIGTNQVENRFIGAYRIVAIIGQQGGNILLKLCFVAAMLLQVVPEGFVVGEGKGVSCVVNQLTDFVVVQQTELFLPLQLIGKPSHISGGVAPVMAPHPLVTKRTLEIGCKVFVRFHATQLERSGVPPGEGGNILICQIGT